MIVRNLAIFVGVLALLVGCSRGNVAKVSEDSVIVDSATLLSDSVLTTQDSSLAGPEDLEDMPDDEDDNTDSDRKDDNQNNASSTPEEKIDLDDLDKILQQTDEEELESLLNDFE